MNFVIDNEQNLYREHDFYMFKFTTIFDAY